jgi:hypothetical protein
MASKNFYTIDSYDKLFAKCDGTTTTFVDSSTANPKTITANGNATQLSIHADFAGKRTAGFFNGTTDDVRIGDSADWDFDGDFEIQLYINFLSLPSSGTILEMGQNAGSKGITIYYASGSGWIIYFNGTNPEGGYIAHTPSLNTWYKLKVNRVSGVAKFFIDDVQKGSSWNYATAIDSSTQGICLGSRFAAGSSFVNCWLKNLTITKAGTTVLDMKFDNPATSPLGPAIYFDGTGDYLSLANSTDWNFGTGDFTIEGSFWLSSSSTQQVLWDRGATAGSYAVLQSSGDEMNVVLESTGKSFYPISTSYGQAIQSNRWYHFAWSRASGTLRFFVNGVPIGAGIASSENITDTSAFLIGSNVAVNLPMTGFIREFRISNVARYTSAFTPSQTGFTVDSNTKLYIKGDENNGSGQTIVPVMTADNAPSPYVASASSTYSGSYPAYAAFDGNAATRWATPSGTHTGWLKIDIGTAKAITGYRILSYSSQSPTDWTVQGSNNDSTWTTLDTRTGQQPTTLTTFSFTNSTAYRYYKLDITACYGTDDLIGIVQFEPIESIVDSETSPKQISIFGDTKIKYTEDYRSCIFKDDASTAPIIETELVTNGTDWTGASGTTPPDNWSKYVGSVNDTYDIDSGTLKLTTVDVASSIEQVITTVVGQKYLFSVLLKNGDLGSGVRIMVGTSAFGGQYLNETESGTSAFTEHKIIFTATTTTTYIDITAVASAGNQYGWCDTCSMKAVTHYPYPVGSAKVDFFSAFGSGVGYFDGTNSYLSTPNDDDFKFGTGDFDVEGYYRIGTGETTCSLLDMAVHTGGGWGVYLNGDKKYRIVDWQTDVNGTVISSPVILENTWNHFAMARSSGVTKFFHNGTELQSKADTADYQQTRDVRAGVWYYTFNGTNYDFLLGLMDNIRISKGVARYTETFNPPKQKLSVNKVMFFI